MNSIMIPHSPSSLGDLQQQIREAIISGGQVPKAEKPKVKKSTI
jgi:hypothetical protein